MTSNPCELVPMPPNHPRNVKLDSATINLASVAYGLESYLRARNCDPDAVLRQAELVSEDLLDPERRIPLVRYLELLEICAKALGDQQFGLKFGAQYDVAHAGVVGNVALASPTIHDALKTVARYLPVMVSSAMYRIEVTGNTALAYAYYVDPLLRSYRQKSDWSIAFTCNIIRRGLDNDRWHPDELLLPYALPDDAMAKRAYRQLLGGNPRGGQPWAGIRFNASVLEQPMATANAMLERLMRHYGDLRLAELPQKGGQLDFLRRETATMLMKGYISVEALAKHIGLSVRTLQRRLNDAGTSYTELLSNVRQTLSLNLLENQSLSISEIAFSLGYSEVSSFNHAFQHWTGQTPGEYRRSCNA